MNEGITLLDLRGMGMFEVWVMVTGALFLLVGYGFTLDVFWNMSMNYVSMMCICWTMANRFLYNK
jgi:hypothetical protein